MHVTVAICTWNRAALLDATLAALHRLEIPEAVAWELLVVDNNCTDATQEVIARHAAALPIRALREPAQGLSRARNHAVRAAEGELIIWTDDDVIVDPAWLGAYVASARAHPEAAFFGGPIEPWFSVEPPARIRENLRLFGSVYALRQRRAGPPQIKRAIDVPFGANFAMRRSALGPDPFDVELGRKGDDHGVGEEVAVLQALLAAGHEGIWVEAAPVRHYIPEERLSETFLWRHYYSKGRIRGRRVRGARAWMDVLFKHCRVRTKLALRIDRQDESWARVFKTTATTRGMIDELLGHG
jgi:glycosyltransferase involved in cell wall biosynthesis